MCERGQDMSGNEVEERERQGAILNRVCTACYSSVSPLQTVDANTGR